MGERAGRLRQRAVVLALVGLSTMMLAVSISAAVPLSAGVTPKLGVQIIGQAPLSGDLIFWAGTRVVLVGTTPMPGRARTAVATFDPKTGAWSEPVTSLFTFPLYGTGGVWARNELMVLGVRCRPSSLENEGACSPGSLAAATFSIRDRSWKAMPVPDGYVRDIESGSPAFGYAVGWTGREAVFKVARSLVAFNPRTKTWRQLPDPGDARVCAYGSRLVAVRTDAARELQASLLREGDAAWQPAVAQTVGGTVAGAPEFICGARGVLAISPQVDEVWLFDTKGGAWVAEPPAPRELVKSSSPLGFVLFTDTAWTGSHFALWSPRGGVLFDPVRESWRAGRPGPTLRPFAHTQAWTDAYAFSTMRGRNGRVEFVTYKPG
jgi:hypothetical protein